MEKAALVLEAALELGVALMLVILGVRGLVLAARGLRAAAFPARIRGLTRLCHPTVFRGFGGSALLRWFDTGYGDSSPH